MYNTMMQIHYPKPMDHLYKVPLLWFDSCRTCSFSLNWPSYGTTDRANVIESGTTNKKFPYVEHRGGEVCPSIFRNQHIIPRQNSPVAEAPDTVDRSRLAMRHSAWSREDGSGLNLRLFGAIRIRLGGFEARNKRG